MSQDKIVCFVKGRNRTILMY